MNNNQTFVVIMSAGRCGSTSTMNFLNELPIFNIYGENYGFILDLLSSISTINQLIKKCQSSKIDTYTKYENQKKYCKNGFYYDNKICLINIRDNLLNQIKLFFDPTTEYIGFKEIRWIDYDLNTLNIIDSIYKKIKYIHISRDLGEQINSFKRTWMYTQTDEQISNYITNTNNNIIQFLTNQNKDFLSINMSTDKNFLHTIRDFILEHNNDDGDDFIQKWQN